MQQRSDVRSAKHGNNKKYWWYDKPEIGSYMFCYDESRNYKFYIEEVSVKYVYGWTEEERQRRFKGAKFIWGGCCDGVSYQDTLKSDNIENAKREFEAWYKSTFCVALSDWKMVWRLQKKNTKIFFSIKRRYEILRVMKLEKMNIIH